MVGTSVAGSKAMSVSAAPPRLLNDDLFDVSVGFGDGYTGVGVGDLDEARGVPAIVVIVRRGRGGRGARGEVGADGLDEAAEVVYDARACLGEDSRCYA